jgi:8-oxo-dGTP diphosphatase
MKILLREYLKEFLYFRKPEEHQAVGFKGLLKRLMSDNDQEDFKEFLMSWISHVEDLNDWEVGPKITKEIFRYASEVYPSILRKVEYDKKIARKNLSRLLGKKFYEQIKKSQSIEEIAGDYTMAGSRRLDSPGNIRAGYLTKGSGRSIERDSEEEQAKLTPAAAVVLVVRDGKVLAVSRGKDYRNMNMPGGGVEPGESPEEAAIRELEEETGLIAQNLIPVCEDLLGDKVVYFYRVTKFSGNLKSSHEGIASWEEPAALFASQYRESFKKVLACLPGDVLSL